MMRRKFDLSLVLDRLVCRLVGHRWPKSQPRVYVVVCRRCDTIGHDVAQMRATVQREFDSVLRSFVRGWSRGSDRG